MILVAYVKGHGHFGHQFLQNVLFADTLSNTQCIEGEFSSHCIQFASDNSHIHVRRGCQAVDPTMELIHNIFFIIIVRVLVLNNGMPLCVLGIKLSSSPFNRSIKWLLCMTNACFFDSVFLD